MDIRRYGGVLPRTAQELLGEGLLLRGQYPTQKSIFQMLRDGVDITYLFQRMGPINFRKYSDLILQAAYEEAFRYEGIGRRYAVLEVKLGGKTTKKYPRTYQTAYHSESAIMVYGEVALGYDLPKGVKKPFLVNKVEEILEIPEKYKDKYKDPTYRVLSLRISIRVPKGEELPEKKEAVPA